jgi:hypothetical protein
MRALLHGLSSLLGLKEVRNVNIRNNYWWNSSIQKASHKNNAQPTFSFFFGFAALISLAAEVTAAAFSAVTAALLMSVFFFASFPEMNVRNLPT